MKAKASNEVLGRRLDDDELSKVAGGRTKETAQIELWMLNNIGEAKKNRNDFMHLIYLHVQASKAYWVPENIRKAVMKEIGNVIRAQWPDKADALKL